MSDRVVNRGGQPRTIVSVVFPCLNEAASIGRCVDEANEALASLDAGSEVVVVDNGSEDGSDRVAREHGARVVYEDSPGYGSALRRGIEAASGDIVVMADADCTYELSKIPDLVAPIRYEQADLVLGERLRSANRATMPFLHRYVGTPVLSALVRRAAGSRLRVSDSQSGFRAFRRDTVLGLNLRGTGMEFASEMLIQAARHRLRIVEVPTRYSERVGDSKLSTFSDGLRHLVLILLLAPSLLLKAPGALMVVLGAMLTGVGFLQPAGMAIGSWRWQPVFLATILVVVGALALLAGTILEHHSPLVPAAGWARSPFRSAEAASRLALFGLVTASSGAALNFWLLLHSEASPAFETPRMAAAGLATSLIIVGSVCMMTGVVGRILVGQLAYVGGRGLPWLVRSEPDERQIWEPLEDVEPVGTSDVA